MVKQRDEDDAMVKQRDAGEMSLTSAALLGVWLDLERALEGKNGYGGDVAEIYAYRLTPPHLADLATIATTAGHNLTRLLREFVELHAGVEVGIEVERGQREFRPFDPRAETIMPFGHRIHLRVRWTTNDQLLAFGRELRALRERAYLVGVPRWPATVAWLDAVDTLLRTLGVREETP